MSFWKKNVCVPTWQDTLEAWWSGLPPRLLQAGAVPRRCGQVASVTVREIQEEEIPVVCELWTRGYAQSQRVRCTVPGSLVKEAVRKGRWTVWVAVHADGRILGTLVRRHLKDVQIGPTVWKDLASIDYFYVVPGWKQKGVGRSLLCVAHNTAKIPMCPQLILWEGVQAGIPPIASGIYWSRQREMETVESRKIQDASEIDSAWSACLAFAKGQGVSVRSLVLGDALETSVWKVQEGYVVVWDTHHRSIPEDKGIGMILACSSFSAAETFAAQGKGHPWKICLSSWRITEAWALDSPFQWIAYNCQTGFIDVRFPCLAF